MQDRVSPREARSSYDVYAKPVLMSQPQETKFKQRQRLLSDDQTKQDKQDSRPPTPPGKLQMSKITSMLQSSTTEGSAVLQERPSSPDSHLSGGQPPVLQNGRAKNASETTPRHQAGGSNVPDDVAPSGHKSPSTIAVAEVCDVPPPPKAPRQLGSRELPSRRLVCSCLQGGSTPDARAADRLIWNCRRP